MRNRKAMTFGVTVVAVMLALASVAFACTTFKGRFEVTAGGGTSKAWGGNSGMTHCTGAYAPVSAAEVPTGGGTITVAVSPTGTSGACQSSQLADTFTSNNPLKNKHYYIYYVNRNGFVDNNGVWKWSVDCMAGTGSTQLNANDGGSNEITITNGSSASRTYAISSGQSANSTTDRAGVCISDTGAGQGNQTPIRIVTL